MSADHHFPRYHVRPATGYVNDPNGPIHHDGQYHLYFQYVEDTPRKGPVHWGHSTSTDLVHWTVHPEALRAVPETAVAGGCWSGNTVEKDGRLYAFFSVFEPENPFQPVFRAESRDGGMTFTDPIPVVAGPEPAEQAAQFRDPFVWRQPERWCMLAGAELPGDIGQARLYESEDLTEWRYAGPFLQSQGNSAEGAMWECPQYATFGDEGVLLIAAYHPRGEVWHVIALRGRESASALIDPALSIPDAGPAFYAPSLLRGTDRTLLWGWVTENRDAAWCIEQDWSGCLTIPRELRLLDDGRVGCVPAVETIGLRSGSLPVAELPAQFEAELRLTAPESDRSVITLAAGAAERAVLAVEWSAGRLVLDLSESSTDERAHRRVITLEAPELARDRRVTLRWFLDGSVGELFTDGGRALTHRFYATTPPPWSLRTQDVVGDVTVHRIEAAVSRAG